MDDEQRTEQGMAVRRAVLGDAHVDRAVASTSEFTAPFQDWITRYAWGEIWSRPGLSRPERSIVTLTVLAALQQRDLEVGVPVASIRQVVAHKRLIHIAGRNASDGADPVVRNHVARALHDPSPPYCSDWKYGRDVVVSRCS